MGLFFGNYTFGLLLQLLAIVHFIRRRPNMFWLWIILIGGGLGAMVYLAVEALPELGDPGASKYFQRRRRLHELQGLVAQNPSAGNYEELGGLYLDSGEWARARACFDKAISSRTDSIDPFYRRAIAETELGDFQAAVPDLERVVAKDREYDFHRAAGLLAHAYARTGQADKAARLFDEVTRRSTLSETQYHYAELLAAQGRRDDARQVAQQILQRRTSMPGFMKRRDRRWFRESKALLGKL